MAGPLDFTGQNIENSYQRILQTDGTLVYTGTGSLFTLPSAFPYTGSALITGSLGITGSIILSSSNYIRFNNTGSGTNTNYSDLSVYRYPTYDTPALKLIRPDGIGFNLYRQGSTSGVWLGDENGNRNMTMYSNAFGAFTFVAPGSGGDFSFTGGDATTPAYASSIVFKTNDYTVNAATSSDHSVKIQGPNVTGSNLYNLVSFQVGSAFTEKAAIRYDGGAYFSSSVGIGVSTPSASLHISSSNNNLLRVESLTSANIIYVTSSGNVGISTTTPSHRLHVVGATRLGNLLLGSAGNNAIGNTNNDTSINITNGVGIGGGSLITPSAQLHVKGSGATSATTALRVENTNASASMVVLDNGFVGIGTGSAQYNLDVYGNYHQYQAQGLLARYDISSANANQNRGVWDFYTNAAATPDFFGRFGFKFEGGTADSFKQFQVHIADSTTPKFVINGSGNVGIRTITPSYNLDVSGSGNFTNGLTVTGSLRVSGSITSSLQGTASYATQALSASYVAGWPFTGFNYNVTGFSTPSTGQICIQQTDGIIYEIKINKTTSDNIDLSQFINNRYEGSYLFMTITSEPDPAKAFSILRLGVFTDNTTYVTFGADVIAGNVLPNAGAGKIDFRF